MKINSIHIENFKSIVDLTIVEPNPLTVFVGSNGSGKSNIFEAIEYAKLNILTDKRNFNLNNEITVSQDIINQIEVGFGGNKNFLNKNSISKEFIYEAQYILNNQQISSSINIDFGKKIIEFFANLPIGIANESDELSVYDQFYKNFSKIFIGFGKNNPLSIFQNKLTTNGDNVGRILENILSDEYLKEDIIDYLNLFIPEFENIETKRNSIGESEFLIYEKFTKKPFDKFQISDGTRNLITLISSVLQSVETPQFLCIEEPENGIHPYVQKELIEFFRYACEEKGHYIWLNTHSQSIVQALTKEEIILVNKKEGKTVIKQLKDFEDYEMKMDDAWLTNFLQGGLPW